MKIKLNEVVTDPEGNAVTINRYTGKTIDEIPVKFSEFLYKLCLILQTKTVEDTKRYYKLMQKLYNSFSTNEEETELTDQDIELCNELLKNQKMVIKARFLELTGQL